MDIRKRNITVALMVAMFLAAVEGTIVTTAIPTIVKDLNGFKLISWVFSTYFFTAAISTPVYGKLADLYGRKNVLSIGIIIFLVGSSFCGISQSMYLLIGFRALQGLGAGAIFTVTYTIVGDIFNISERAKVQGGLSTVWGIASLVGPFMGGFLIDNLSWHWIFFINIPFGILAIVLLQRNLNEKFEKKKCSIDYSGIVLLSAAIISLLYGVLAYSILTIICFLVTAIFLCMFYFVERRAEEPIMPFEIFTKTNIIVNIISFLAACVLIGMDVYMPIYLQNVLGVSATISGVSMAPMSVSWLLSSFILSKAISRYGEKIVTAVSMIILILSSICLSTLNVSSSLILVLVYVFVMGFGFGGCFTTLTIVVQESVDYNNRGAAIASNSLVRTLGQTIGVSVFGSLFNLNIVKYFSRLGIGGIDPSNLYSAANLNSKISEIQIRGSLNSGLHVIFITLIIMNITCLVLSFLLSSGLKNVDF